MKLKSFLLFLLVLLASLFTVMANGNNELGYIQVGSTSEDPVVSMKTLTTISRYDKALWDTLEREYEGINNTVLSKFSEAIDAFYALEPEIWETDEMFEERLALEEELLVDAFYHEVEKIALELLGAAEEQSILLDGYAAKARANLLRSRTLASSSLTVQSNSYDRNTRLWSLSLTSSDKRVPFTDLGVVIDFTTIGDEELTRTEIIKFDEAVKGNSLTATADWHYMQDSSDGSFLLGIDFLSITNPLTGSNYAVNLAKPILIKTYRVTGETVPTLTVLETTMDSISGVTNLVYSDEVGDSYSLSSTNDTHFLAWNVSKQGQRPIPASPVVSTDDPVIEEPAIVEDEGAEEKSPMMPNIPLTRLDGVVTSLSIVRGDKPAVINYFASWCPPCKQELPHFQKAFDEYGNEVSFIFLDALDGQRETLKTINAFIESFPFTGPVFYDNGEFAMTFQTNSLPTTVFIDKDGRVVKGYLGFVPEEVLYADIADLLH